MDKPKVKDDGTGVKNKALAAGDEIDHDGKDLAEKKVLTKEQIRNEIAAGMGKMNKATLEKLYAAIRGGIKTVLIPEENVKDLAEVNKNVIESLNIVSISEAKMVLGYSLTKTVSPIIYTESTTIKNVKSKISQENLPESTTH